MSIDPLTILRNTVEVLRDKIRNLENEMLLVRDASQVTVVGNAHKVDGYHLVPDIASGWFPVGETWTYFSADAPTFTFTISGDKTTKYFPGMRIKLTQTTVKFFIITVVSYSAPNTTVTIYGGTDYTLANATITSPFYSSYKAPFGFPLNPNKWTVEVTDTTNRTQATPTASVWYNLGSVSINIPIGIWDIEYAVQVSVTKASVSSIGILQTTLSTANNSESDTEMTTAGRLYGASGTLRLGYTCFRRKIIALASKTTYFINTITTLSDATSIDNFNNTSPLIIRAICAYL